MNNELTEKLINKLNEVRQGYWIPACGGTETPFTIRGVRVLYCWNPVTGKHAYLNVDSDIIMTDQEFFALSNG